MERLKMSDSFEEWTIRSGEKNGWNTSNTSVPWHLPHRAWIPLGFLEIHGHFSIQDAKPGDWISMLSYQQNIDADLLESKTTGNYRIRHIQLPEILKVLTTLVKTQRWDACFCQIPTDRDDWDESQFMFDDLILQETEVSEKYGASKQRDKASEVQSSKILVNGLCSSIAVICVWADLSYICRNRLASQDNLCAFQLTGAEMYLLQHLKPLSRSPIATSNFFGAVSHCLKSILLLKNDCQFESSTCSPNDMNCGKGHMTFESKGPNKNLLGTESKSSFMTVRANAYQLYLQISTDRLKLLQRFAKEARGNSCYVQWNQFLRFSASMLHPNTGFCANHTINLKNHLHEKEGEEGSTGMSQGTPISTLDTCANFKGPGDLKQYDTDCWDWERWESCVEIALMICKGQCGVCTCLAHCCRLPKSTGLPHIFDLAAAAGWAVTAEQGMGFQEYIKFDDVLEASIQLGGITVATSDNAEDTSKFKNHCFCDEAYRNDDSSLNCNQSGKCEGMCYCQCKCNMVNCTTTANVNPMFTQKGSGPNFERTNQQRFECRCLLCHLRPEQQLCVFSFLDSKSISAFSCTGRKHWRLTQKAVPGLDVMGVSSWSLTLKNHTPLEAEFSRETSDLESLFSFSENIQKNLSLKHGLESTNKIAVKRGGLFKHQLHALLWLLQRERPWAIQQPPVVRLFDWTESARLGFFPQLSMPIAASSYAGQSLTSPTYGNKDLCTSLGGVKSPKMQRKLIKKNSGQILKPQGCVKCFMKLQRQPVCRGADDIFKGVSSFTEIPLVDGSWIQNVKELAKMFKVKDDLQSVEASSDDDGEGHPFLIGEGYALKGYECRHPTALMEQMHYSEHQNLQADHSNPISSSQAENNNHEYAFQTVASENNSSAYSRVCTMTYDISLKNRTPQPFVNVPFEWARIGRFSLYLSANANVCLLGFSHPTGIFQDDYAASRSLIDTSVCKELAPNFDLKNEKNADTSGYNLRAVKASMLSQRNFHFPLLREINHGLGGIFCDDPGLGKTLSMLTLVVTSARRRRTIPPSNCPMSVINAKEVSSFFDNLGTQAVPNSFPEADAHRKPHNRFGDIKEFCCYEDPEPDVVQQNNFQFSSVLEASSSLCTAVNSGQLIFASHLRSRKEEAATAAKLRRLYKVLENTGKSPVDLNASLKSCLSETLAHTEQLARNSERIINGYKATGKIKTEEITQLNRVKLNINFSDADMNLGMNLNKRKLLNKILNVPTFLCSSCTLIICPPFLTRHWVEQVDQWFNWSHMNDNDKLKVIMIENSANLVRLSRFEVAAADLVICNVNVLTSEYKRCSLDSVISFSRNKSRDTSLSRGDKKRATKTDSDVSSVAKKCASAAEAELKFWGNYMKAQQNCSEAEKGCVQIENVLNQLSEPERIALENCSVWRGELTDWLQKENYTRSRSSATNKRNRTKGYNAIDESRSTSRVYGGFKTKLFDRCTSPLLGVHFARLAVDEGHRLLTPNSQYVQVAKAIRADKRWIITGTPTNRISNVQGINGIKSIYDFLNHHLAKNTIPPSLTTGSSSPLRQSINKGFCEDRQLLSFYRVFALLNSTVVRHSKSICNLLPPVRGPIVFSVQCSDTERETYNDLVELTRRNLFCTYYSRSNPDSLFNASNRNSALTTLWNLKFTCTFPTSCHFFVLRKWIDEMVEMLTDNHMTYRNRFHYPIDRERLLFVVAVFFLINTERHAIRCDQCLNSIKFPLVVPCRHLHLFCSSCLFPDLLAESFLSRPPLTSCPLCWPFCPIDPDFFDRLQPPVEHSSEEKYLLKQESSSRGERNRLPIIPDDALNICNNSSNSTEFTHIVTPCVLPPLKPLSQLSAQIQHLSATWLVQKDLLMRDKASLKQILPEIEANHADVISTTSCLRWGDGVECGHSVIRKNTFVSSCIRHYSKPQTLVLSPSMLEDAQKMVGKWFNDQTNKKLTRQYYERQCTLWRRVFSKHNNDAAANKIDDMVNVLKGDSEKLFFGADFENPVHENESNNFMHKYRRVGNGNDKVGVPCSISSIRFDSKQGTAHTEFFNDKGTLQRAQENAFKSDFNSPVPGSLATESKNALGKSSSLSLTGIGLPVIEILNMDEFGSILRRDPALPEKFVLQSIGALNSQAPLLLVDAVKKYVDTTFGYPGHERSILDWWRGKNIKNVKNNGDDDLKLCRSSKFMIVVCRILALIATECFGQNNISWEKFKSDRNCNGTDKCFITGGENFRQWIIPNDFKIKLNEDLKNAEDSLDQSRGSKKSVRVRFADDVNDDLENMLKINGEGEGNDLNGNLGFESELGKTAGNNNAASQKPKMITPSNSCLSKSNIPENTVSNIVQRCEKIIVASSMWESLFLLGRFLEQIGILCAHFYPNADRRQYTQALRRFCCDSETRVLLLSNQLGAHGLDLSCASHVLLLDPPADSNLEKQVIARAHRMGALRPVQVEIFLLKSTVEETTMIKRSLWSEITQLEDSVLCGSNAKKNTSRKKKSFTGISTKKFCRTNCALKNTSKNDTEDDEGNLIILFSDTSPWPPSTQNKGKNPPVIYELMPVRPVWHSNETGNSDQSSLTTETLLRSLKPI